MQMPKLSKLSKLSKTILGSGILFLALLTTSCGYSTIEQVTTKGIIGLRAARKISSTQYYYGHISKDAYRARLKYFYGVDNAISALGDQVSELGEITPQNKAQVLTALDTILATIDKLVKDGSVGVKNPASQDKFSADIAIARAAVIAIRSAIAIIDKPTKVDSIQVRKGGLL